MMEMLLAVGFTNMTMHFADCWPSLDNVYLSGQIFHTDSKFQNMVLRIDKNFYIGY